MFGSVRRESYELSIPILLLINYNINIINFEPFRSYYYNIYMFYYINHIYIYIYKQDDNTHFLYLNKY